MGHMIRCGACRHRAACRGIPHTSLPGPASDAARTTSSTRRSSTELRAYLDIDRFRAMQQLSRITPATVDVLAELLGHAGARTWGLEIIRESGRPPGTVYPILERLERSGWVESSWEDENARPGPRRRLYALTTEGAAAARSTVAAFRAKVASGPRVKEAMA